jgi:hypothetical protein
MSALLTTKPIDRWLQLASMAVGLVFWLLPKTPLVIVSCLLLIFLLLLHPLWNLWWIENYKPRQVFVMILLAAICITIGYKVWPEPQRINEPTLTETRLGNIEKVIKGIGETYTREALLKKYPMGYVVFDLEYTNSVFPYDQKLPDGFELDWKGVGFTAITKDSYELRLPSVSKDGQKFLGNPIVSGPKQADGLGNGFAFGDTLVVAEILAITERGMVFVIGFKQVPGISS